MTGKENALVRETLMKSVKTVVVKVGSATLTDNDGRFSADAVRRVAKGVLAIREQGRQVALVSSGAIAAGLEAMSLTRRPEIFLVCRPPPPSGRGV